MGDVLAYVKLVKCNRSKCNRSDAWKWRTNRHCWRGPGVRKLNMDREYVLLCHTGPLNYLPNKSMLSVSVYSVPWPLIYMFLCRIFILPNFNWMRKMVASLCLTCCWFGSPHSQRLLLRTCLTSLILSILSTLSISSMLIRVSFISLIHPLSFRRFPFYRFPIVLSTITFNQLSISNPTLLLLIP